MSCGGGSEQKSCSMTCPWGKVHCIQLEAKNRLDAGVSNNCEAAAHHGSAVRRLDEGLYCSD
jgi:hypothetical protein